MPSSRGTTARLRQWLDEGRIIKDVSRRLLTATADNDLLTYASAACYQIIFALAPVMLAGLAVLGFLHLEEVWDSELASGNRFWLTTGVVLAL